MDSGGCAPDPESAVPLPVPSGLPLAEKRLQSVQVAFSHMPQLGKRSFCPPLLAAEGVTMTYSMNIAGLQRELPLCKLTDDLYIAAFICFGDAELTVACATELLKLVDEGSYDYLFTAEAKSIPIIHEMARQSGASKYFIARKGAKAYMPDPLCVEDESITTAGKQKLFLGRDDAALIRGKRILIVDDVISTGGSLKAMEALITAAGGVVVDRLAVLAEGGAKDRTDIKFLAPLPLFNADGTVK